MLDLEYTAVAAYRTGAPLLRRAGARLRTEVLEQEQEHAAASVQAIRRIDGAPNRPQASTTSPLSPARTDALRFAAT